MIHMKISGAIAIDDRDGDITDKIVITGKVDTKKEGIYIITYTVEDLMNESPAKIWKPSTLPIIFDSSDKQTEWSANGWEIEEARLRQGYKHNFNCNVLYFDGHTEGRNQAYLVSKADGTKDAGNRGRLDIGFSGNPF